MKFSWHQFGELGEKEAEDEGGGDGEARGGSLPHRLDQGQGGLSGRTTALRPWPLNHKEKY